MTAIEVFVGAEGDPRPACRHCARYLVPCPRGEACIGTAAWTVRTVCECLHGLVCPVHRNTWAPAR